MKKTLLIISGWAHSTNAIQPLGDRLATHFDVQLLSGATALTQQTLPQADAILTGSMGGLIAFEQLPKRCQKLVLLSGTACFCKQPDYEHGTAPRILKRMQKQLDQDPHTLIQTFFKNVHAPHRPSHQKKQPPPLDLPALHQGLDYLRKTDLRTLIPSISIPVLIMHGTQDQIIPIGAAQWLHNHLPQSEFISYKGHGHALAAHAFEQTMQAAEHFLA
jgi:pimeloyl-[acyl-carrier protein] methyl ester esterase